MYRLAVRRDFVAQHFLFGGDWGDENRRHSHHYQVEVEVAGPTLDRHGYLVDIVDLEVRLDELVTHYRDCTLNELPEFAGINPSIEHFCRIFCDQLRARLTAPHLSSMTVRIWEADIAWAAYQMNL